ncbi:MAG: hypothetical protein OXI73_16625 [Rhodospirillales bacterium]|nr:hypothetical protein [Rhodospirillales bacterium]MDE0374149.1 hypothetical protein [Rhodospirillales bacterium]
MGSLLQRLPKDRTTRILLAVVVVMGAAILAGTAILIVALIDLASQLGSGVGSEQAQAAGRHD